MNVLIKRFFKNPFQRRVLQFRPLLSARSAVKVSPGGNGRDRLRRIIKSSTSFSSWASTFEASSSLRFISSAKRRGCRHYRWAMFLSFYYRCISDHVLENDFSSGEKGLMTQNWNPLTAKMLYNYDHDTFQELTKRLSFPVLHITSCCTPWAALWFLDSRKATSLQEGIRLHRILKPYSTLRGRKW